MSTFEHALAETARWEGGQADHPADPGGRTAYGATIGYARAKGYTGPMSALDKATVHGWFREDFWDGRGLHEVEHADAAVAAYLFDTGVNHSPRGFALVAQRAVSRFHEVAIDGRWGPETRNAIVAAARIAPRAMLDALRVERCRYGVEITGRNRNLETFLLGWFRRWLTYSI